MHPLLFKFPDFLPLIGGKGVHTYGFMIALAFLFGMTYVSRESKRVGLPENKIMDMFFYIVLSGLIGSRLFYIFHSVDDFWADPMVLFRVWEGGLVFQGGVILAVIVSVVYLRKNKLPYFKTVDVFAPPLALGHGLGRIGCFFAGCCFGKQCDPQYPLGIVFPNLPDTVAPHGIPLYPTQLFEAFAEMAIFLFLFFTRKKKPFHGAVFVAYLILYSIVRFFNEFYRGDTIRGGYLVTKGLDVLYFKADQVVSGMDELFRIYNGQLISLLTIVAALILGVFLYKKHQKENVTKEEI